MQLTKIFTLTLICGLMAGCVSTETEQRLPQVATSITLFSEFPQQEEGIHKKLHKYFNLDCENGSSMSVITPLHINEDVFEEEPASSKTQYKIVIGNNLRGNTVYYTDPKTEHLAHDIADILNGFISSYDLEFSKSINNVLPFNAHHLDHTSYLSTLASNPNELATTFKIGIDHTLPLAEKTQLVVNLVVYLAKTLGSECLYSIPNNSDLQFSMENCQCPPKENDLKSYENSIEWM